MVKSKYYLDVRTRSILLRIGSTNYLLVNRAKYHATTRRNGKRVLNSSEMWNDANGWWVSCPNTHTLGG
jgi:hypothetical protein